MNIALSDIKRASLLDALCMVALAVRRGDLTQAEVLAALQADSPDPLNLYSLQFLVR
jgi:hypothetical protein